MLMDLGSSSRINQFTKMENSISISASLFPAGVLQCGSAPIMKGPLAPSLKIITISLYL